MLYKKVIGRLKKLFGLQTKQHMLDLTALAEMYHMDVYGAVVVGAHLFREHNEYLELGCQEFVLIEPIERAFAQLHRAFSWYPNYQLFQVACGSAPGYVDMYVETKNDGQSCSLLTPDRHLLVHPEIEFTKTEYVRVVELDRLGFDRKLYNFLSVDVQGFELEVLKGAEFTLRSIDYILCEVNKPGASMYKNATNIDEVDAFLAIHDFIRPQNPIWIKNAYSDVLYIRKSLLHS